MQLKKMTAKEMAGIQRRDSGAAAARSTGAVSVRRGTEMVVCNVSSSRPGAGGRGALRSNTSICSSFISSFVDSNRPQFRFIGLGPQKIERPAQAIFDSAGGDAQRFRRFAEGQTLIVMQVDDFPDAVLQSFHQRKQPAGQVAFRR